MFPYYRGKFRGNQRGNFTPFCNKGKLVPSKNEKGEISARFGGNFGGNSGEISPRLTKKGKLVPGKRGN